MMLTSGKDIGIHITDSLPCIGVTWKDIMIVKSVMVEKPFPLRSQS